MRIALLVFNQVGRGTYWRAFHFGRVLAKRGHAVTVLAISPRAHWRLCEHWVEGVQVIETPDWLPGALRSGWDVWDMLRRMQWIAGQTFDIVHAFEARPVVLGPALLAQKRGAKLVMDWCDWFGRGGSLEERPNPIIRAVLRPVETFFEERFRTCADGTTVINTFLRERVIGLGVQPEMIRLLRNGSDTRWPLYDRLEMRQALGLPVEAPLIGYVGSSYPQDARLMAEALNQVRQILPEIRLVLVGYFNRPIEAWLAKPELVIRTGNVTSIGVHQYLSACDICWLPLKNSGANQGRWPMKLNDYLTAGRPIVATAIGDLPEVTSTHQFGVVAPDTPETFAAATTALLGNTTQRTEMEYAARYTAETVWNWETLGEELEAFYQQITLERQYA